MHKTVLQVLTNPQDAGGLQDDYLVGAAQQPRPSHCLNVDVEKANANLHQLPGLRAD